VTESAESGEALLTRLPLLGCGESYGSAPAAGLLTADRLTADMNELLNM
jgi:hypothetical protein